MKLAYPMQFHRAEEGGYWVQGCPPLTGIFTEGDTLAEAKTRARESLTLMLEGMLDEGQAIPKPPAAEGKDIYWIEPEPEVMAPILLRWAREEAHLTQGELANKLGITYQSVQKLERSGANPTIKTLAKVARALGRELHVALG